jgi:glycosyltransferase involved in cell wall biosynthesis
MARIAFVVPVGSDPWGASAELWSRTARILLKQGHEVLACGRRWPEIPQPLRALQEAGCRVIFQKRFLGWADRLWIKLRGDQSFSLLDRFHPHLVVLSHGHFQVHELAWMRECLKREIPYVTLCHLVSPSLWPHDGLVPEYADAYGKARACYFVSKANLELARLQLVHPLPKAKVVRNPFNVSYDAKPSWPSNGREWRLACVARLFPAHKGQDLLLEVLRMPKWRKRALRVTFYGEGVQRKALEALKRMWRLEHVEFVGFVSDIGKVWAGHHGLVLPSRAEGLPLALVEAMLCGRPAIVTDVAGGELVEDGMSGFVANAPTVKELDAALERAWERREDWQRMGEAAAKRVRELVPHDPVGVFVGKLLELLPRS